MPTPITCAQCGRRVGDANSFIHGKNCRGFRPSGQPVNITEGAKENRGWTVFGSQDHRKIGASGVGYAQTGYIFNTEKRAKEFYELEK